MLNILTLSDKVSGYLEPAQIQQIKRAYYYAEQAHDGQIRRSGEPYVTHPLAVADILADMRMDHQSLMAAMLHDVIEDTGVSKAALDSQFGDAVADLVDGVSKLTQIDFETKAEAQAENFQKMALAMANDIRVILVKLADRLHNMRTLGVLKPEKRRRIARETLEIYAPIANRLGMNTVRMEFEDLCFQAMYPMRAARIKAAIKRIRGKRNALVEETRQRVEEYLANEGLNARVYGREKHLYSIYQKMRQSKKPFADIMDMFGFRIIVDNVDTCYRVLGAMHSLYKPVPGQFKDYIAIPKSNGYQSLHTILIGMHGVPIEVQIRTEEMDEMASNGIAAHWLYKQGSEDYSSALSGSHQRARQWVQGLLEMQQRTGNSLEFIENVKIDLFPDEVYVFTPKGKILELPHGATPVDFAYAVHTDLGNRCVGCYINRRLSSLSQPLKSGETVEIITSVNGRPSPVWLDFVVTGKARSHIRHVLKSQRHSDSIDLGRRLLDKALQGMNYSLEQVSQAQIDKLLESTRFASFDFILEDIGIGNRAAFLTARQLLPSNSDALQAETDDSGDPLVISGTEGMILHFAKCCHPLPGDHIIGHMSVGRGVVVHVNTCQNARNVRKNRAKVVELQWADNIHGEFHVPIAVDVRQTKGIVALLATKINSLDANIESINVIDKDAHSSRVDIEITVHDRVHLARIMRHIRNIRAVNSITRVKAIARRALH
ncbi:MAG TPA: RelA/SpoT family protein [Pseudomonadales bacterium]